VLEPLLSGPSPRPRMADGGSDGVGCRGANKRVVRYLFAGLGRAVFPLYEGQHTAYKKQRSSRRSKPHLKVWSLQPPATLSTVCFFFGRIQNGIPGGIGPAKFGCAKIGTKETYQIFTPFLRIGSNLSHSRPWSVFPDTCQKTYQKFHPYLKDFHVQFFSTAKLAHTYPSPVQQRLCLPIKVRVLSKSLGSISQTRG